MLAQNFKTPTDLGIEVEEFEALTKVLGMLERNELIDTPEHKPLPTDFGFSMGCQFKKHECGTVACIGGWAAIIMRHPSPFLYVNKYIAGGALHDLYWTCVGHHASVEQAGTALRNFLTRGNAHWREVVAEGASTST